MRVTGTTLCVYRFFLGEVRWGEKEGAVLSWAQSGYELDSLCILDL